MIKALLFLGWWGFCGMPCIPAPDPNPIVKAAKLVAVLQPKSKGRLSHREVARRKAERERIKKLWR